MRLTKLLLFICSIHLSVWSEPISIKKETATQTIANGLRNTPKPRERFVRFEAMFWPGAGIFQRTQSNAQTKGSGVVFTPPVYFYFSFPVASNLSFTLGSEWMFAQNILITDFFYDGQSGKLNTNLNTLSLLFGFGYDFRNKNFETFGRLNLNIGPSWVTWYDNTFSPSNIAAPTLALEQNRQDHFGIVGNISYRQRLFSMWNVLGFFMGPSVSVMWSNGWGVFGGINIGISAS